METESPLGCRVRLIEIDTADRVRFGGPLLLTLDMPQEGDGRHAEVVLSEQNADELARAFDDWYLL
jgi:hypothetical protein